ncbi:MAG TPA: hypothetical protein VMU89_07205 [Thermomicrobiaceae bacterium]|nr:hypothetical protein [Thermomicrobiaceae bacterium]
MSGNLPALPSRVEIEASRRAPRSGRGLTRWLRSPLGAAAAGLAPELLKVAGQALQTRAAARPLADLPPSGANGLTVSEVEIDVATPFVRRVVVRTASAWSVAPEVILASQRPRRRAGRLGFGAAGLAGLAVLGIAAARRGPVVFPGRFFQGR